MAARISVKAARDQLAAGHLAPIYLVTGDDETAKSALTTAFAEQVEEGLRAFNVERFYGTDAALDRVLDAARTLPFCSGPRIVIVLQAEKLLEPKRDSEAARRSLDAFGAYLKAPVPQTVVVLVAAALDGRTRLAKAIRRAAVEVACAGADGLGDAGRWIRQALAQADLQADRSAVQLIVERAGDDVGRLRAQVERLQVYCAGQGTVSRDDVLAVVRSPVASDDWAVTHAIERGRMAEALRALALGLESGAVPYKVLGQLAWFARTCVPSAKATSVIDAVFETDLALKSSRGDPRVLLERLVVQLCESTAGREPVRRGASRGR